MHVIMSFHDLGTAALQDSCHFHTIASVTSDFHFAVVDDLQHLHCLLDTSVGTWVRNLHELHWHVGMSGLDVPFGIACNLAGELQLTSGDPDQPDPFLQVICISIRAAIQMRMHAHRPP
jgi:hypothetical protein